MGRLVSTSLLLLVAIITFGQDDKNSLASNKFKFRSIETGFGFYIASSNRRVVKLMSNIDNSSRVVNNPEGHVGPAFNISTSFSINKNIFSIGLHTGVELVILGGKKNDFYALNLSYGRAWELVKWFAVETHVGVGLYSSQELVFDELLESNYVRKEVLGIPIDVRFMFHPAKRFGIGVSPSVNFNAMNTTYTVNMVFQYKFK